MLQCWSMNELPSFISLSAVKLCDLWVKTNCSFVSDTELSRADSLNKSAIRQFRKFTLLIL